MILYLIENDKTIDVVLKSPAYTAGRDVIVCFNYLVLLRMKREIGAHKVVFLEELLDNESYRKLHAITDRFAMEWYRAGDEDISLFEGTSFGMMAENMFPRKYMLNILVKIGEVVRCAVERWKDVKKLYCDFTNQGNTQRYVEGGAGQFFNKVRTVEIVARQLGLPVHFIESPAIIPAFWHSKMKTVSTQTQLKSLLKRVITWGINTVGAPARLVGKPGVYIFGYYNLQSLQAGRGRRLVTDSYKLLKGSPKLLMAGGRLLNLDDEPYMQNAQETNFISRLQQHSVSDEFRSRAFELHGISYRELYQPAIQHLAGEMIPALVRSLRQMREAVRRYKIEHVVFIDTIDTINRVRIQACKQAGCRALVVYHGLFEDVTEQEVVKRRIPPDVLVTPGDSKYSPQYIDNFLAPPEHVLSNFGSPIIDQYPPSKRKRITGIRKVLFLTMNDGFYCNLSRFAYQELYLGELFSTIRHLSEMGIEVHYRPHPGENRAYHEYLFDFFGVDRSSIHFSDGGLFSEVVRDMDMMVTNVSTAFFESQAAGIPTVFLDPCYTPEAVQPPLNGNNGEEVLRMTTGRELLDMIRRNQHDPKELNSFLDTFLERYAPRYVGPLDGQAGKRIAEYIGGTLTT